MKFSVTWIDTLVILLLIYKVINLRQQIDESEIALHAHFPEFIVDFITLKVQRSFNWKAKKLYTIHNMKQSLITLWTVNSTVICFGIMLRKQFDKTAVVYCLMAYYLQRHNARPHAARHTVKQVLGFRIWRYYAFRHIHQIWHSATFTSFWP